MPDATRTFDLTTFGLSDMTACGAGLRGASAGAASFDDAAQRIVGFLRDRFRDPPGTPQCALIRCFHTAPFGELGEEDRQFVRDQLDPGEVADELTCLRLAATVGDEPDWNDRERSVGHRVTPLPSPTVVETSPMIAALLGEFGLDPADVVAPDRAPILDRDLGAFNVFHVEHALDSPHVPAQDDFVVPHRIQSVLGFGAMLPTGQLFAVILFSRVPITEAVAARFETVALNAKVALLPYLPVGGGAADLRRTAESRAAALEELLSVQQHVVAEQGRALEEGSRRLRDLTDAAVAVNEVTGVEAMLERITVAAVRTVGASRGVTTLSSDDASGPAIAHEWPPPEPGEDGPGPATEGAELTVPMRTRDGRQMGTIRLRGGADGEFTDADRATLLQLAQIASLAIENAQLAGQQALREAARFREELLAGITHDMKTPLAAVVGLAETVGDERLSVDEQAAAQQALVRQARSLRGLVLQFLDYTRLEAGHTVEVVTEPVAVEDALTAAVRLFAHLRDIELVIPDGLPEVSADPVRLEQVVSNLLSNALKFSPPRSPVTVRAQAGDGTVEITVDDEGTGLEAVELLQLFQKFYRGSNTERLPGTGLGLYVTRMLVEAMGGQVRAESEPGRGSRFTLTLPVASPEPTSAGAFRGGREERA